MSTISVVSTKGGTGKSTTAIALSLEISQRLRERKQWVALIDADRHVKTIELKLCPPLSRSDPRLEDVLEGRAEWKDAVYTCALMRGGERLYPNLAIMPAGSTFLPWTELPRIKRGIDRFSDIIDELKKKCSFVIIDTPASFSLEHFLMLAAADTILPVVNPNDDSINATKEMLKTTRDVLTYVDVAGVVLNRMPDTFNTDEWVRKASELGEVLGIVPQDPKVDTAFSRNLPVGALFPSAPSVQAIRSLTDRLLSIVMPESKLSLASKVERAVDVLAREELRKKQKAA